MAEAADPTRLPCRSLPWVAGLFGDRTEDVDELVEAGYVERTEDGVMLTPEGEQVARQLAMTDEGGQDALMEALLDA